ncbi:MAG: hypothetical protein GXO23_02635 [Crenarchaeota archaeon]|nr:hypothetical protein [Thermoproteota archaeon]
MIICLRTQDIGRAIELIKSVPVTGGGSLICATGDKFVEEIAYTRSSIDVREHVLNLLNIMKREDSHDIVITLSDSYMTYRPCIDSTLCLTYKGLVTYHMIYNIIIEKNMEIPEPRPDIALVELLSNIYDSEGEYSLEKTVEILGEYVHSRNVTPKHLAISITQIRDCCVNPCFTLVTREEVNIYTLDSENMNAILYVEPELEEYPNVRNLTSIFRRIRVLPDTQYIARLGRDHIWVYQRRFQQK